MPIKTCFFAAISTAMLVFAGCASAPSASKSSLPADLPPVIRAFADICIKTAPDFAAAPQMAAAYSIHDLANANGTLSGTSLDKTISLQIKPGKECVIASAKQRNLDLTAKFLRAVSHFTAERVPGTVPAKVMVGKDLFIFHHDRKDAETFVMLKAKN